MTEEHIHLLIEKYLAGKATHAEREQLLDWYRSQSEGEMELWLNDPKEKALLQQEMIGELKARISGRSSFQLARTKWIRRIAIAASVILVLGVGYWLLYTSSETKTVPIPLSNRWQTSGNNRHISHSYPSRVSSF